MFKLVYILFFYLLLSACNSNSLAGNYEAFWYETYNKLELYGDYSYKYEYRGHRGNGKFKGHYEISNDTIILNGPIEKEGLSKFLLVEDGCLIEMETRFEFCIRHQDEWGSRRRAINYPQLKEKSANEKKEVIKMLEVALTNPKLKEYFDDSTKNLIVQEYFEIRKTNNIELTYFGQPIKLMSELEIKSDSIKKYLIIDEVNIGLNSAMIDFQVMPEFSVGVLDFFDKQNGEWILNEKNRSLF